MRCHHCLPNETNSVVIIIIRCDCFIQIKQQTILWWDYISKNLMNLVENMPKNFFTSENKAFYEKN